MQGKRIAQYEVLDTLGVGGMGTVYRARVAEGGHGLRVGDQVALKVVHAQLLEQPGFFKRFLREAQIGRQVKHENVVQTYDCDALLVDGRQQHYLVMELVEGQTLRGLADELGTVPEELCRHIGREVARGLTAIHAVGVVHRDLKPENVLITKDHEVKVMDLGVAHLQDDLIRLSRTGAFIGSLEYAAPEQFRDRGGGVDARADLHALGLVLYELSTGRHPFRSDDAHETLRNVLEGDIRPAGEINPELSPWFEEVVRTLTAREPDDRFASAQALQEVLEAGEPSPWWQERAQALRAKRERPLRRIRMPRDTALYGREDDLERLQAAYESARSGQGRVVLVEGEAGIGKTRLVDEFVARLRHAGEDVNFLFGSYPPGGAATAAGAFSTAYREQFGIEGLEVTLATYVRDTPLLIPAFAALLRGDAWPAGQEALTKDSLQTVFVHATRALAEERPTIVLIDDLHFAPEAGRALFSALAAAVPEQAVLLIGTMRRGVSESWISSTTRLDHVSQITLPRLGPKDLARLLEEAFQSKRLAGELDHLVSVKSDGNPFFAFEIIRGLREGNFIAQRADGTWISTGEIEDLEVPSSVLDLVDARMAGLTEEERDLLDLASCCGFEFDPCLVADAIGLPRIPALKGFARIERRHRLVRTAGHLHEFDHHQIQEALYRRLMPQLKKEYHAALGDALEAPAAAAGGAPTALDGPTRVDLCEHHLRGSRPERAVPHLVLALHHLEEGYLNDQAIRLADRALAFPDLLAGAERARVLLEKCKRLDILGRREEEAAAVEEACALAASSADLRLQARALQHLGGHQRLVGRHEDADATLAQASGLAHEAGDAALEASTLAGLGNAQASQGRYPEARRTLERSLRVQGLPEDDPGTGNRIGNLAAVLHTLGEVEQAQDMFRRHLQAAMDRGDRQAEVLARGNLGMVLTGSGKATEAREHFERALETAREIGDRLGEVHLLGNLGNHAYAQGRLEAARSLFHRALALSRETGSPMGEAIATGNLGNVCYALGRYEEALEHYGRTLTLTRESRDRYIEIVCLSAQAEVDAWLGAFDRGRERLEAAHALAVEAGVPFPRAEVLIKYALLEDFAGRADEARARVDEALELLSSLDSPEETADALLIRARLREAAGEEDAARADFERARDLSTEIDHAGNAIRAACRLLALGVGTPEEAEAVFREQAPRASVCARTEGRWLLWQATKAPGHLEEAHALVVHVRDHAPPDLRTSLVENVPLHRAIMEAV